MRMLALALVLLSSCAAAPGEFTTRPATPISWPPGESPARVELLFTYSGSRDASHHPSLWGRIGRLVLGPTERALVAPYGMALTTDGALLIADPGLGVVHRLDLETAEHEIVRGSAEVPLITPVDVAAAPDGRFYVTDSTSSRIVVFSPEGEVTSVFGSADEIGRPTGIVYDRQRERLLVVDTTWCRLLAYDLSGKLLATTGARGSGLGEYNYPTNVALDRSGTIYLMDTLNFRVQILSADFEPLSAFGIPGSGPGTFSKPKGIALDSEGHIYVVDALFENVQIFDREGQLLLTFFQHGTGFGGLTLPTGILIDDRDRIFLADSGNSRIQFLQYNPVAE